MLINKVGVGAVNGLNSCQVAGCPESRRGPAEYRTDRSRPPNSVRLRTPSQPQLRLAALQSAAPLHTFLGEASSGQACLVLARDQKSDVSWDDGSGIKWMVESG